MPDPLLEELKALVAAVKAPKTRPLPDFTKYLPRIERGCY